VSLKDTLNFFDQWFFRAQMGYDVSLAYSNFVRSGLDKSLWNPEIEDLGGNTWSWQYNTVGLQVESRASGIIFLEILSLYRIQVKVNMRPFYMVPIESWIAFVRPDTMIFGNENEQTLDFTNIDYLKLLEKGEDLWVGFTYTIELLKFTMDFSHNFAGTRKSILGFILDLPNLNFHKIAPLGLEDFTFD
jgi:hypothetical protein